MGNKPSEERCETCEKKIPTQEKKQNNGKCSDCFYEDQSIKKGIVSEEDVLKQLEETLEEAKSLCDQQRRTEEEQWNRTEVIKDVFTFERNLEAPGVHQDQTDHGDVSESEAPHLLCRKFKRLLSQEPMPISDCLSQVQGKLITKLCCTAQSNSANIERLSNMVHTVCQAALLSPSQKWTLSQHLLDIWQSMLNMEYPETIHSLSPHLHCWSTRTKEITEENKKGLIVLELLLTKLDLLAEGHQDKAWLNAEKECLKFILNKIELDTNIGSILLGITGPRQWTGVQSLQLLVSLARRKPPSSEAGNLLELLQRYHVTATWRERGGKTVPEILLTEVTLSELCERLKDQLAENDEKQFELIRRQNSIKKYERILQVTCEKLQAKNIKWKWIETAISACVIILLVEYMADYFGPLFQGVVCTAFCALFLHTIVFRKKDDQKAAIEQQPEHVLEVCKAMLNCKGLSPSYYQMETLCELAYARRRRPWRLVSVVSDDPSLAAMLTALNAKRSGRVGVLQDVTSHQLGDWHKFYQIMHINVATDMNTKDNTGKLRNTVVFGHLQSFINDYVQHYPWVSEEDEIGSALHPNHLILGGYLPAESLKFNNLSEEATFLQLPLCTLTECAGENASQKVEFISIIFFGLKALADGKGSESLKYASHYKLAHICETFSGEILSRKQLNLLRLLEIILRYVHKRQQPYQEAKKELPFEGTLYMMCFDTLMKSAREICREDNLQDSLVILSNLVQRQLWDPIEVLDVFSLLTEKLGRSGGFHKKVVSVLKLVNPLKFQRETPCPQTLSSVVKTLHLMTVNRVSSSFKDLQERSIKEILEGQSMNLYEELRAIMQMDREKSLKEILDEIQQSQNIEAHVCDTTRSIVEYVMNMENTPLNQPDKIQSVSDLIRDKDDPENLKLILLHLCSVVVKTMSLKPRITQMVSWCLLVLSKTGRLLQLGTGEGKSCVVAMFAAYRAKVCEENVDILSSSPVLAKRDAESWRPFYDCLQITVECNADKLSDETRKKCYESTVVYGTVECFAADCLRQDFEKKDIRPNRGFHCIIVDEVDSLLLDKGIQTTYLSQDMPALQHLEIILAVIWSMVSVYDFVTDSEGCNVIQGPIKPFYKALFDIIGHEQELGRVVKLAQENIIPSDLTETDTSHIEDLKTTSHIENLKSVGEDSMINFFCRAEKELHIRPTFSIYTQDEHGHLQLCPESHCGGVPLLVLNEGHCCELFFDRGMLCSAIEDGVKSRLNYSKGDASSAPKANMDHCVLIPSFLEGLVNHKIGVWIRNAFQALEMQENEKYKVECDGIYPVDFEHTGMVERNKKWGDGLQQFIEMKHQRKLSNMSVITNYLSNVTFFRKYSEPPSTVYQIFGTTGTLGNEIETLRHVYGGLQACRIPSFKQSKLFEAETVIVDDEESWRESIISAVLKQTRKTRYRGPRATLVICETIKNAKILRRALMDDDENKIVKLYTDSSDEGDVTTHELVPGDVIVATNLAGRGTDFQVCEKVKNAGGLFVILTFLAGNSRVEQQAFGRSARQGSPGSAQLILCSLHLPENVQHELQSYKGPEAVRVEMAKRARDKLSELRTSETLEHDLPIITQREELFSSYCKIRDSKYGNIKDTQLHQMTVAMLNEFWGIWLLMKSEDIKYHRTKQLKDDLEIQISQAQESFKRNNSPHSSIYHYIKFANKLLSQREYEKSSELYTEAIDLDSNWAAIAFYYRALCSYKIKNKENMTKDDVKEMVQDLEKAKESVNLFIYQCQVIQCLLRQSEGNPKQNVGRVQSLELFMENKNPKQQDITKESDMATDNRLQDQIAARMNIWTFFLDNIEKVIGEIRAFKGMEMKATMSLVKSPSMDDHRAMYRLYQLGLERVFGARDSIRFRWEGLAIIGLGATQILAGIAVGDIGLSLLNLEWPFGVLTKQGYNDILTGISALTTGEFSFNNWKNYKVASFCVDITASVPNDSIRKRIHKVLNIPLVESSPQKNTMNMFKIIVSQIKHDLMKEKNVKSKEEVKEEGNSVIKHLCDSVKESIEKKSKKAMKKHFRSEPLQTLLTDIINFHHASKFIFTNSSLQDKSKDLWYKIFKEITERAIETSCNGKKKPQLLFKITKGLEQILKDKPESITSPMKTEYEDQWKGTAPDALIAIADDFKKDLCRLLEDLLEKMKAKNPRKPNENFHRDDVKALRKDLYKNISKKLSDALNDLLQMTLEHQQVQLLSSAIMGQVNKTIQANRSQLRMPRRIGKQRRPLIRRNTKHILSKLERDHDHRYTEL